VGKVTAGLAESNDSLPPGGWLSHLWADYLYSTPGSAPGPTLGNEYVITLLFYTVYEVQIGAHVRRRRRMFNANNK